MLSIIIRVKICYDKKLEKFVAIKIIDKSSNLENMNSFLNEIEILTKIHFKNNKRNFKIENLNKIVKIIDFGFNDYIISKYYKKFIVGYYIMELASYGELYKIIDLNENIPESLAKYIFIQILEGNFYFLIINSN